MRSIPNLYVRRGQNSRVRHYWIPSKSLRLEGWAQKRLSDDPDAAAAEARYENGRVEAWRRQRALDGPQPPRGTGRTVRDLIAQYQAHRLYTRLRPSSKTTYRTYLRIIEEWAGDEPAAAITPAIIEDFYVQLMAEHGCATVRANSTIQAMQVLYKCAMKLGWVDSNPAARMGLEPAQRMAPVVLWTPEMVTAFASMADSQHRWSIGTAVVINEWWGQRLADILAMRLEAIAGLRTDIRQQKTRAAVQLPTRVIPHVAGRIDEEMQRRRDATVQPLDGSFLVSEATGRPWLRFTFAKVFRQIADLAANDAADQGQHDLAGKLRSARFCWLRHTAVTRMAEAGCTLSQIAAVTGHSLRNVAVIIQRYLVVTGRMSEEAFRRRLDAVGMATDQRAIASEWPTDEIR